MTRRAVRIVFATTLFLLACVWSSPARAEVDFDLFYSGLSPHGSWLVSARYGRVWQPGVYTEDWNPYYDGRWVYSDVGWTWVSDYAWGAIPYHYGTWVDDPALGWVWVPGYVWAPAWVTFRIGPDYIGWAPVSPGFTVGVSAGFGARVSGPFVFVAARDFLAPRLRACIVPPSTTRVILNRTTIVNTLVVERNVVVNRGPDVRIIERASGRRVSAVPIERVSGVAPGRRLSRDQLAVETRGSERGLRAAEPAPASGPPPARDGRVRERPARNERPMRGERPAQVEPPPRARVSTPGNGGTQAAGTAPAASDAQDHGAGRGHHRSRPHARPPKPEHP